MVKVIAEIGVNHNGDLGLAKELVCVVVKPERISLSSKLSR